MADRLKVTEWTKEQFCVEFFASLDEFYADWKNLNNGSLPDWEAAILRAKREGVLPHPAFRTQEKHPGEVIREGDVHKPPEKDE